MHVNLRGPMGQIIGRSSTIFVDFLIIAGPRPLFFGGSGGASSASGLAFDPSPTSGTTCDPRFLFSNFLEVALRRPDFLGAICAVLKNNSYELYIR